MELILIPSSFIVKKKMVEKVNRLDNYILLLYSRLGGSEVHVGIGDGLKKEVREILFIFFSFIKLINFQFGRNHLQNSIFFENNNNPKLCW